MGLESCSGHDFQIAIARIANTGRDHRKFTNPAVFGNLADFGNLPRRPPAHRQGDWQPDKDRMQNRSGND